MDWLTLGIKSTRSRTSARAFFVSAAFRSKSIRGGATTLAWEESGVVGGWETAGAGVPAAFAESGRSGGGVAGWVSGLGLGSGTGGSPEIARYAMPPSRASVPNATSLSSGEPMV